MIRPLRLFLPLLLLAALAACQTTSVSTGTGGDSARTPGAAPPAVESGRWLQTENSACKVWDPFPAEVQNVSWTGPCVDGKAQGDGELTIQRPQDYRNPSDRYLGHMTAGKMHGRGKLMWERGGFYDGQWRDGLPHGNATMVTKSGVRIVGDFVNGIPEGKLVMTDTNGMVFDGRMTVADWAKPDLRRQTVRDLAAGDAIMKALTGEGTIIYPDGQRFEGRFNVGENWIEGICRSADDAPYFPCCRRDGIWVECPLTKN